MSQELKRKEKQTKKRCLSRFEIRKDHLPGKQKKTDMGSVYQVAG